MTEFWTEDRIKTLIVCVDDKMSARETAAMLGGNRNQMIGKAKRLGYHFHSKLSARPRRARAQVPVNIMRKAVRQQTPQGPFETDVPPSINDLAIPIEQRRSILTVGNYECKFGIGDPRDLGFFLCGAPTQDGNSFCAAHYARCYHRPSFQGNGTFRLPR